jgi:pSer/pThr/pTyr-binding forkhead associated (FHA) protein
MVALEGDRITLGRSPSNSIPITSDPGISRTHAVIERLPSGWCVRDMGSSNGTFVNGKRVWNERPLRAEDDIRIGETRAIFHTDVGIDEAGETLAESTTLKLTPRERDVLVELCRPALSGGVFTEPASIRQIADALFVTEAAVKQHLLRLYDKFEIHEGERRRVRLANDAVRRGLVSIEHLRHTGPT